MMLAHILTRGTLAALAGAALLAATTTSAPAFTPSAPSRRAKLTRPKGKCKMRLAA